MTASRFCLPARIGLATWGLLAVFSFSGCSLHQEYMRRGALLDSVAVRTDRIGKEQASQAAEMRELRAETLTEIEVLETKVSQLEARVIDFDERMARIGRKLGVWREAVVADTSVASESAPGLPDTSRAAIGADQLYNTAYLDFTRGKYKVAIAGFRQFLQMFPNSDMSDNALYWIGECHYSTGELNKAEKEFKQVLIRYPRGNKVPAAAYKLGLVYHAQGRDKAAQRQFQAVVEKYPGTTEAKLAQEHLSQ